MSLNAEIESVRKAFRTDLDTPPQNPQDWEALRVKYFGRKGLLAGLFRQLGQLDPKERPAAGKQLNTLKQELTTTFEKLVTQATTPSSERAESAIDYTLPGIPYPEGSLHPLNELWRRSKTCLSPLALRWPMGLRWMTITTILKR